MKKLVLFLIVFLLFSLSLFSITEDQKLLTRKVDGLAPQRDYFNTNKKTMTADHYRDPDFDGYGYNAYDPTGTYVNGPIYFPGSDPSDITLLAPTTSGNFIAGACWIADEETWYGGQYGGGLYSIDHITGNMTFIGNTTAGFHGLEYDDASGIMYGSDGANLYTVDWTTGASTLIGPHNTADTMIGIAGDGEGNMYGVTVSFTEISDLYLIDLATGNATSLGSTGGQFLYAQDLAFDKDAGILYNAAYFGDGTPPGLYEIDTNTCAMTWWGDFAGGMEVTGFAVPYTLAEAGAPAAPSDLVVTPDPVGALSCDLSWTNPDLTFDGDPLTELLEMRVYRNDVLVYTDSSPTIGGASGWTDNTVSPAGLYNYAVRGYNSDGEGPAAFEEVWVGEDVPNAVTDLTLTDVSTRDLMAQLDWTNPTDGMHGGYFPGVTGYLIERHDGADWDIPGPVTQWVDDTIVDVGIYSYSVIPYNNSGTGPITYTPQVGIGITVVEIGNAETLDYQIPMNIWYQNSMVEVVYQQEWLGTGMNINAVSFHANISSTINPFNFQIWMGELDIDDLTGGWIDGNSLTQVFNGMIDTPPGDYWLDITLDEPFEYTYTDNLVLFMIKDDDEYYSTQDTWYTTESGITQVTAHQYSDTQDYDAFTGPWTTIYGKSTYPDVRFYYTPLAEMQAPAEPTNVTYVPDAGGALECTISWICPTLDYAGDPLTELLEMRVYRDGSLVYTDNSPIIGGAGQYIDTVPVSGFYTYMVTGYNSYGEGDPVEGTVWVGEDVPNVVTDLVLVEQNGNGLLTWVNPTTGFNGGPFNEPILGYEITRNNPDSSQTYFNITGIQTQYVDTAIPEAGYYSYDVTAYNSIGLGGTETSNTWMLGAGEVLFYDDFETDLSAWNVINNGGNGVWVIYFPPYPNNYQMPPESSGGVCSADSDEIYPIDSELQLAVPLDCSTCEMVNLQFDNDWNPIQEADYCYIDVSNDGGATWNNVLTWGGDNVDITATHEIIDISAYADFQPSVLVRFHSVQPGWDWWWTIDNVGIYGTCGPQVYGSLEGYVTEYGTRDPIEGAIVTIGSYTGTTNDQGYYFIDDVGIGIYDVYCTADGYVDAVQPGVEIFEEQTTQQDFELLWSEIAVDPTSFDVVVPQGETLDVPMSIINDGPGELTYNISFQELDLLRSGVSKANYSEITLPALGFGANNEFAKHNPKFSGNISSSNGTTIKIPDLHSTLRWNISVCILSPDPEAATTQLQTALDAFDDLDVSVYPLADLPTISGNDLAPYEVVIVYNDYTWVAGGGDAVVVGDALADYIDLGGTVIDNLYLHSFDDWGLGGRYINEQYSPFTMATTDNWSPTEMGTVYLPDHPIMTDVATAGQTWGVQDPGLAPDADLIADWDDGNPFLAANNNVVGMNIMPLDPNVGPTWTGDVLTIYYNAVMWLSGRLWVTAEPSSGTVPGESTDEVTITFNAGDIDEGTVLEANMIIGNNSVLGEDLVVPVSMTVGPDAIGEEPIQLLITALGKNFPNPFNPVTNISYSLSQAGDVTISIYNIKGQKVKTLVNEKMEAGRYITTWYGKDNFNRDVSSGVYFYKMHAGKYTGTKKMILMK